MNESANPVTRRRFILVTSGLIILSVLLFLMHSRNRALDTSEASIEAAPAAVQIARAETQPMDLAVTAQGTLTPAQGSSAQIAPVNPGRLLSVRVREGDTVSAGQIVAVLDNRVPQAQAQSAAAALQVSRTQADQAAMAARSAATDQTNAVRTASLELQIAESELKKLENGARPQEVAQAEQVVKQAQATRDRAATELDRVRFLYNKGIDSKRQLDDAQTSLSVADSALASAKEQANLVRSGTRPEDLQAARLKVASARVALKQAHEGALQVASKQKETQVAVESIRQKEADLAAAKVQAAYSELRSPISGKVIRRSLNPGDMADTTTPVVEIANTRLLNLVASIPAEDGASIRVGMPVRVHLTTEPDRIFSGSVVNVGEIDPQSGMLSVRIVLPGSDSVVKVGAFASADIIIRTNPNATAVPKSAVISRNGSDVVFVVDRDGIAHQVTVQTGVEQGNFVEIKSGISPGDRVITVGQYELADGAKVKFSLQSVNP